MIGDSYPASFACRSSLISTICSKFVPASYVIKPFRDPGISRCTGQVVAPQWTEVCLNLYTVETVPQRSQSVDRCHLSHRRGKVREFHHQARAKR